MAKYRYTVHDEALTGATWGVILDVDADGRGMTASRDPSNTDLASVHTSDIAITLTDRASGTDVSTGATWSDLANDVRFDWATYGLEVDLRFLARTSGVWGRTAGLPAGQPQSVTGGTEVGRLELGEHGYFRPLTFAQADWLVEDRPEDVPSAASAPRYCSVRAVRSAGSLPTGTEDPTFAPGGARSELLGLAIAAAEQMIDDSCGQTFAVPTAATTMELWPSTERFLRTPPLASLMGLEVEVEGEVWDADRYRVATRPTSTTAGYNIRTRRTNYWPYQEPVMVTARFGWPIIPEPIRLAAVKCALREYSSSLTSSGMIEEGGGLAYQMTSDVKRLLQSYRRWRF